jgi:hypothetical protein
VTDNGAASSTAEGRPWLALTVAGSERPEHRVPIHLRWSVRGLSFWERWGGLILLILAVLTVLFVITGFVVPNRFSGTLALSFVPDREELDEQSPQPIRQWRGVGIGFYRDARAFLHPDYRVSGKARGAIASLHARPRGARVAPVKGSALFRESIDGTWDDVAPEGRPARAGDVYRVGERGPYFRISTRR